jgi:endonuclease YncB( thermonuclease family)
MDAEWSLVSVYDADSFHVNGTFTGDMPFGLPGYEGRSTGIYVRVQEMVRLVRCDAAELDTALGRKARDEVRRWFAERVDPENLSLRLTGRDKYKRLLADVVARDGSTLSEFVLGLPGSVPMKLFDQIREP